MTATVESLFISQDKLALLLFGFLVIIAFRKESLYSSFKLIFFSGRIGAEHKSVSIIGSIIVHFFFLGLSLCIFKWLFYEEKIELTFLLKLLGVVVVKILIDLLITKSFKESSMKTYLLLKEKGRCFLAVIFLIPVFFLIINPFFQDIMFAKIIGGLFFIGILCTEYLYAYKSNIHFLIFILYLCAVDLGLYFLLFSYLL